MFVDETARGTGLAGALMEALEHDAQEQGLSEIKLETGHLLQAAHRLYARHGFVECGPFGDYPDSEASLFMTKVLCTDA